MPSVFNSVSGGKQKTVRIDGFAKVVTSLLKDVKPEQTDNLFRVVDQNCNGFVSLQDFTALDLNTIVQTPITTQPKDILMPLFSKIRRLNLSEQALIDKFGQNGQLTDLAAPCRIFLGFEPSQSELSQIKAFLTSQFQTCALSSSQLSELIKHKFSHESSLQGEPRRGASEAAVKLRDGLKKRGQTLEEAVMAVGVARSDFQNG